MSKWAGITEAVKAVIIEGGDRRLEERGWWQGRLLLILR